MAIERRDIPGVDVGGKSSILFAYIQQVLPMPQGSTFDEPLDPFEEELLTSTHVEGSVSPEDLTQLAREKPELMAYLRRTGDRIVVVKKEDIVYPERLIPPVEVLKMLCNAPSEEEIGMHGMPIAATVTQENQHSQAFNLFAAEFYSDGREIAQAVKDKYPRLLLATINRGAELQGTRYNQPGEALSDEEPGKIFHEYRRPEDKHGQWLAETHGLSWPYEGRLDTTVNFIRDIADCRALQRRHPDQLGKTDILDLVVRHEDGSPVLMPDEREKTFRDAAWAAAEWKRRREDSNAEGLIEYKPAFPGSMRNQVWEDSEDSYMGKDGALVDYKTHAIAPIEVQVSDYEADLALMDMFPEKAQEFAEHAAKLSDSIMKYFWVEDRVMVDGQEQQRSYFALGTTRDTRDPNAMPKPLEVLKSNAAHVLNSSLLAGDDPSIVEKREKLIATLCAPEMWSSGGLRTLASNEFKFHPDAYHNGSVWPWDMAVFAVGLDRHGYHEAASYIFDRIKQIVEETHLYPEKVSGDENATVSIDPWTVDVLANDGKVWRTAQPPQLLQGFTVEAYERALLREEDMTAHPDMYVTTNPRDAAFDQAMREQLQAIDAERQEQALYGHVLAQETVVAAD